MNLLETYLKKIYQENESSTKSIIIYHGLGATSSADKVACLEKRRLQVYSENHDYEAEYLKDKGKTFMEDQEKTAASYDTILGISFGGYIAYMLANNLNKKLILINPALDRSKSKTAMNEEFDYEVRKKNIPIELYYGELDVSVNPQFSIDYLRKFGHSNITVNKIPDMPHRVKYADFKTICNLSSFLKN